MESTITKKIDQPKCTEINDIVFLTVLEYTANLG